jgi:hypothetical protein
VDYLIEKYEETYQGHKENPIFFLGTTEWENNSAPFYFYPLFLIIRLSSGVLICFIISLVLYAYKIHKKEALLKDTLVLLVIVIYIIGISLIGKKIGRYLIPIWPVLMLTSAGGLQIILKWVNVFLTSIGRLKNRQVTLKVILGFTVIFPAILWNVSYQPFYVFYFNDFVGGLKGGSQITTSGGTAGSRLVAEYLSTKSNEFTVASSYTPEVLAYFYEGNVTGLPTFGTQLFKQYDYVVFYLTWVQRHPDNAIWQYFKDQDPEFTIIVQGMVVVWVFNVQIIDISP